jgi:hypothetical protein
LKENSSVSIFSDWFISIDANKNYSDAAAGGGGDDNKT